MRVDIQTPQTPWSRGAAFQRFYELGLTREEERNWFQRQPRATQHHGNISYIFQVEGDLRRRADWPTLCSLGDSVRLMVGKLFAKASAVLTVSKRFIGHARMGGWG